MELDNQLNTSGNISRRAVLCGAVALAVGVAPDIASASSPAVGIKQVGKKLQLDLTKNKSLAKVGGAVTIDLSDGSSIAIVRNAAGNKGLVALSLTCTHNGVTVMQNGNGWLCPAHGSEFGLAGKLMRGPARSNLFTYPITATAKVATIG
jgi:Rieske Fe-S protein